jgi:hypothetical protein
MNFKQSIVGFLDVLGFSHMVAYDSHSEEDPKYLKKISSVIDSVSKIATGTDFEIRQFSDSIITAVPYSPKNFLRLLTQLGELQRLALKEEILIRGAVAFGRHFSSDAVMYSQGLISAYNLERSAARYPRTIVDRNLIELLIGTVPNFFLKNAETLGSLVTDFDGMKFIHYLDHKELDAYEPIIVRMSEAAAGADGSIAEKYAWLARYYNYTRQRQKLKQCEFGIGTIEPFISEQK